MSYKLTIPARINILGNPADGVEGDFATISAAIDIYAGAFIEPADAIILEQLERKDDDFITVAGQVHPVDKLPMPYDGELDLLKAAFNLFHEFSPEFRQRFSARGGVRIATWTDVPRQSGLGGSSLLVLLTLGGIRVHYNVNPMVYNDYMLAEMTQRVEAGELGIACGYSDRYVPIFGGLAYLDYRGKLWQRPIYEEPFVTYERLDSRVAHLPLVAISTGITRNSGDVHGRMRPRYLEESALWKSEGGEKPPMVQWMNKAWDLTWHGKIAMLKYDWETFGELMNRNHQLVDQMMRYCGDTDGAGEVNNMLIDKALSIGALGAKLTGAGNGGSVFAMMNPGEEKKLVREWKKAAEDAGLDDALIFRPNISYDGLKIEAN